MWLPLPHSQPFITPLPGIQTSPPATPQHWCCRLFLQATTGEVLPNFCKGSSTLFLTERAEYYATIRKENYILWWHILFWWVKIHDNTGTIHFLEWIIPCKNVRRKENVCSANSKKYMQMFKKIKQILFYDKCVNKLWPKGEYLNMLQHKNTS